MYACFADACHASLTLPDRISYSSNVFVVVCSCFQRHHPAPKTAPRIWLTTNCHFGTLRDRAMTLAKDLEKGKASL